MARIFHLNVSRFWCKSCHMILALAWLAGMAAGAWLFIGNPPVSLMHRTVPVSIVRLLVSAFFPFLLSASAVLLFSPRVIPVLGFLRAMVYGYVELGICRGASRWLLFFSQSAALPLFYWALLHHIGGERSIGFWDLFFLLSLIVLIGSMDYCMISPLW